MKLKQPAQERNKEFFLMVQTLFNQASLIVETNLFNYNLPGALDDLNKCEKFRSRTARMNTEGQSCLLDLIDTDQNQLAGCCGFIRVNRIEKEAQLVVIFYEQYIDYIEESIAYILKVLRTSKYALNVLTCNVSGLCVTKETLGILERLNFYDATDELQREGDNHPCYMRFVVDESVRPGRRGDDQSSATGSVGEICRFWARGYCRFGEDCRYLHISAVPSGSLALTGSVISQPCTPALSSLGPPPSSPALSSLPGTGAVGTVQSAVPAIFMPVSAVPGAGGVMGVNGSPLGSVRSNMLPPFYPAAAYAPDTSGGFESPQFAFPEYPYASYSFPSFPYASYPWQQQMLGGSAGGSGIAGGGDSAGGVMTPSSGFTQQQPAVYAPVQMMYGYSTVPGQQPMQSQPFQQLPQMQGQREDSTAAGAASAMMYPSAQMMSLLAQQQAQHQQAQQQAQQAQQGQGQTVGAAQPSDYMFYSSAPPPPYPYTNAAVAPQPQPPQQQGQEADEEAPRPQDSSFSSCSTDNPYYDAVEPPTSTFPPGYPVGGYPGVNYPYPQYSQHPAAASYPSSIDGTEEHNMSQLSFSQSVSQSFSRSQDQEQLQRQDTGPGLKPDSFQDTSFDSGSQEKTNATGEDVQQKRSNDGGSGRGGVGEYSGGGGGKPSARAETTQMTSLRSHSDDQSAATVVTGHVRTVKTSPAPLAPPSTTAATSTAAIAGMHQKLLDLVNTAPPAVLARLRYNELHVLSFAEQPPLASAAPATSTQELNRAEPPQNTHLDSCDRGQQQSMDNSAGESHYLTARDLQSLNDYYQRMLNPAQYHHRFERIFTHGHFNLGANHYSDGVGDASRSDTQEATESSVTIHATPRHILHREDGDADNHSTISSQTSSSPSEEYARELGFEVHDATSEDFNSNFYQYQDMSPPDPDQPEGSWRERCEKGLSGRALSRQVQRRETAHRHYRLRYLLRALQMHRPRGPLNPADVIDLISPLCGAAADPARQGVERDDNACVIDLTDLVALSMQEPHERRPHKKSGDTRSTAMELDLSTPSLAGSRRSAVASAQDATSRNGIGDGDGYESDEEEGDGDGESVLTQPVPYSGTTVAKAETKGKPDGAQAGHNLTQSTSQSTTQGGGSSSVEGKPAGRSFAIRQFTSAMVQCVVNGRAQNGPWPSLPSLLNAMGLSSAQRSVESLLFLNAGVVQAYCAEKSNITAQFRRLQMQQGQQMSSQGQREDLQQRELHAAQGSQDSRQPVVPPQQAQMSASMQQLQQRLLAQQQIFRQQQRQLQQQQTPVGQIPEPSYQQIPVTGDPPPQPIAMPPGGVHPQHLQYWMQQQQQVYMQQFFMQQQAQAAAGTEAAVETGGSALSVANRGGAYAQRQPLQPPPMQREEPPTESPLAATAHAGASYGPPERLRPPPIQITPHGATVPAPVVPPRAQFAPQSYPHYAPQRSQYPQSAVGISVVTQGHIQGQANVQGPQGHSAVPSERQYNIRSTLAQQQQQQQPALRQPQEQERVTTSAGAASRPPPIYPRAAAPAPTSTAGPAPPARLPTQETRSNRTNATSSEPDSASQQQLKQPQQQPTKKRKPRKASRDGSGVSVSGGSSGQESPSPFPRAYPTYPAAAATTGMEKRQGQQQGSGQQQEQQMYYGQGSQDQPSQGLGQGQSLRKQQPAAAAVPVRRPPAPQTQLGEKRA